MCFNPLHVGALLPTGALQYEQLANSNWQSANHTHLTSSDRSGFNFPITKLPIDGLHDLAVPSARKSAPRYWLLAISRTNQETWPAQADREVKIFEN